MELTVEVAEKEDCQVELNICVPSEEVEKEMEKVLAKFRKQAKLPGFRAGKAPKEILKRSFGPRIKKEACESLIARAYEEAIKEKELKPLFPPKVSEISLKDNEPLKFLTTVEVEPKVALGEYKKIPLSRPKVEITDEQINPHLASIQVQRAELVPVEDRGVKIGDIVTINYEGFVCEESIPGAKREGLEFEVGKAILIPNATEELIGVEVEEEKEIKTTLPEDYPDPKYSGKEATFKVELLSIKEKQLPAIDDELAKDMGYDTLEDLKEKIKGDLTNLADKAIENDLKGKLVDAIVAGTSFEIPKTMVIQERSALLSEFNNDLKKKSLTLEEYFKKEGIKREEFYSDFSSEAVMRIQRGWVLNKISEIENIEVSEEEVEEELKRMAKGFKIGPDIVKDILVKEKGQMESLKYDLRIRKTLDFLLSEAEVTVE